MKVALNGGQAQAILCAMSKLLNHRSFRSVSVVLGALGTVLVFPSSAVAATYQVGQGRAYATLQQVAPLLAPGDVVEVDGGATYAGDLTFEKSGSSSKKITIRGIRKGGKRPVIAGGTNTLHVYADHYVFEGLDITGGAERCFFHHGDDITLRDSVVHDCPKHGILGADDESGSLTLDYVEVYGAGNGTQKHQIYMATDEVAHPGAVFRMQHCYVHDGKGGNNIKSRAERNEIYYNWIEGAMYHELELIGPDGADENLAREDSDVVGNVFRKTYPTYAARLGGDGTGQTNGRYRLVGNTFLLVAKSSAALRLFDGIDSVEMHNNVFYRPGAGGEIVRDTEASWVNGVAISGSGNWINQGSTGVPTSWSGTLTGSAPGFRDLAALDVRPAQNSALRGGGSGVLASPPGRAFPAPLVAPLFVPPLHQIEAVDAGLQRSAGSIADIGAYAFAAGLAGAGPSGSAGAAEGGGVVEDDGESSVKSNPGQGSDDVLDTASACSVERSGWPSGGGLGIAALGLLVGLAARRAPGERQRGRRGARR
jgi:hypothetical protein